MTPAPSRSWSRLQGRGKPRVGGRLSHCRGFDLFRIKGDGRGLERKIDIRRAHAGHALQGFAHTIGQVSQVVFCTCRMPVRGGPANTVVARRIAVSGMKRCMELSFNSIEAARTTGTRSAPSGQPARSRKCCAGGAGSRMRRAGRVELSDPDALGVAHRSNRCVR